MTLVGAQDGLTALMKVQVVPPVGTGWAQLEPVATCQTCETCQTLLVSTT